MNRTAMLELLERDEGRRKFVYDDATGDALKPGMTLKGYPTIAIGVELSKAGLDNEEIDWLTNRRIDQREAALDQRWPWWRRLSEARQMVLLSMAYQMGVEGLANFRRMLAACERGDYAAARDEMLASRWATQTRARAERLAKMMLEG